ncbi:MAG: MFS transporter [Actinomycetota bacterium]|nr:MFS transporter [Actinomycetota bacterium]
MMAADRTTSQSDERSSVWWRRTRFPAFAVSRFISQAGDMAAITALTVHVYAITDSGLAVGALFVARVLPRILGLFAGAIGDRTELRRLMIACDLVCGVVFLGIAIADPGYLPLLALVFVAECATTVALPASRTMIGRVVPDEHRTAANGLLLAAMSVGFAGGSALGGLAAAAWDYRWALVANAGSFVISALLLACLPAAAPAPRTTPSSGFLADTVAGLSVLRTNRGVAAVTIGIVGIAFAASIDRPAMIVLVEEDLHASGLGYGLALGGIALGGLVVSLAALRSKTLSTKAMAVFSLGVVVQAAGHLAMGLSPVVAVLVATAVIAGAGNGMESVCGNSLLQRGTPPESLGVIMGVVLSGSFLANAIGSVVGGAAVELLGARWTFVVAAAVMVACAVPVLRRGGREPRQAGPQP